MRLLPGGIDVFYIDESHDRHVYAVSAVAVPFLRNVEGQWTITWPSHLAAAKEWRKAIATDLKIPRSKELHGWKLVSGRGNYVYGNRQLRKTDAAQTYRDILSGVDFLPADSIITVVGTRGPQMFGHERLERVMHALFQRMRSQCRARNVNAMIFFDRGHPEYRELYRRATKNLPTGSRYAVEPRNLPLDMFVEDGNEKTAKFCQFTQLADLIAYGAFQKIRHERGELNVAQVENGMHTLYDALPPAVRNSRASGHNDDIVRLG